MSNRQSINILGNVLVLLSVAFIIDRVIKYNINFTFSLWSYIALIVSTIFYSLLVITFALLFHSLLEILSTNEISKNNSILVYCKSNLYKYLPGNIFHYVGRNQIAVDSGTSHGTVVAATITEMLLLILSAIITVTIFAGQHAYYWLTHKYTGENIAIILLVFSLTICIAFLLYKFNSHIKKWFLIFTTQIKHIEYEATFKYMLVYILSFVLNGAMFIIILRSISGNFNNNLILPVIGMYTLSWLIGFVTPGAPGGLGIREAIMITLLVGIVEVQLVLTAVILYRIVTILGDVIAFTIATQLKRYFIV